jgi:hypothetical protein
MLKKNSVSLFVPSLDGGGAELAALRLAQGFAERGLKVDLVLARAKGAYLKVPSAIRVIDLKSKFPLVLFKTFALLRYLQQEQPMILLSFLDIASSSTWAKRLAGVSTPIVMCVQTHLSQQFQDKPEIFMGRVRASLVRWFIPVD